MRACAGLYAILLLGTGARMGAQPAPPHCESVRQGTLRTPAPLHCVELVAVPSLPRVAGILTLESEPSPFGVAVDEFGHQRLHLVAQIAGLPAPATLGGANAFVAWIASVTMDSMVALGPVGNGRTDLGVTTRDQFRVLVSAERDPRPRSREGPLVLRVVSPSARLLAHRDVRAIPFGPSASTSSSLAGAAAAEHEHGGMTAPGAGVWPMPAMRASMPMMPAVRGLVPDVAPFEPGGAGNVLSFPPATALSTRRLTDHDTLTLTASLVRREIDGRPFAGYAFNGEIPGPLLRVRQGSEVRILFRNDADLPGSIHWHGVRLANAADGAVGITQPPVAPGETYTYVVRFPDAGTFWYHGHVREDIQLSRGLAGNIVVEPAAARTNAQVPAGDSTPEEVLLLGDLLEGPRDPLPLGAAAATHALTGRVGNRALVNGAIRFTGERQGGEVMRVRLTNASAARLFNISWPGARVVLVASDMGPFEHEVFVESVVIAPGERYVVDVLLPEAGAVLMLNRVRGLDHMLGTIFESIDTLGIYRLSPRRARRSPIVLHENGAVKAEIERLARGLPPVPDKTLAITMHPGASLPAPVAAMLMGPALPAEWNDGMPMENWLTTARDVTWVLRDVATGDENASVHWRVRAGERKILRIVNDADAPHAMAHPIHLHGQRFVVLRRNGRAEPNRAWKDTALIPAGETVDLLVDFTNPGEWMLHCHIAEHLGAGMMMHVTVDPAARAGPR